mmetsp:Transcript_15150/g.11012  ORF Transcript_15150/g.11012 Transcript_15150/m.11012 type:complete len:252 (+) Transcript_15150:560-1315(+)
MAILCPVVGSVNHARMKVLSLFVDIPNHHVIALANKCEKFLSTFSQENNDEVESDEDGQLKIDDTDVTQITGNKRGGHKIPKNSTSSNKKFFVQFGVAVLFIMAYFVVMLYFSVRYIGSIQSFTKELNVLGQAESYYAFIQNVEKEFLYSRSKTVFGLGSWVVAKDSIKQLYSLNQYLINYHIDNTKINSDEYKEIFKEIYYGNLCTQSVVQLDLIPYPCEDYMSNSAVFGLQTVMLRYFEQLKEVLKKIY